MNCVTLEGTRHKSSWRAEHRIAFTEQINL